MLESKGTLEKRPTNVEKYAERKEEVEPNEINGNGELLQKRVNKEALSRLTEYTKM